jgi:hypothetical protein
LKLNVNHLGATTRLVSARSQTVASK